MWYWYITTAILSGMFGFMICAILCTADQPNTARIILILEQVSRNIRNNADRLLVEAVKLKTGE